MTPLRHSAHCKVASLVSLRHWRHMARGSTAEQKSPMNFSTNSCERASAGFDWLGTLSIHDTKLKLKDSSLRHTCLFMRSVCSFADLHLIRHACSLIVSENDYPLSSDTFFEDRDTQSKSLKLKDDGLLIRSLDG